MRLFLFACVAALSLAGCEKSSETSITRTNANGVDTLYSKRTVVDGEARFQCIAHRQQQWPLPLRGAGPCMQQRGRVCHAAVASVRGGGGKDRGDA